MRIKDQIAFAAVIKNSTVSKKPTLNDKQIAVLKTAGEAILALAAVAGVVAIAAIAPNLLNAIGKIAKYSYHGIDRKERFQKRQKVLVRSFYYLKRYGYVQLMKEGDEYVMTVTKKGQEKIWRMNFDYLEIPRDSRWRKHWWVVLADIPSKEYRHHADLFREKLQTMNFYPLQRTVWVYPYNPIDQVEFISVYYGIEQFVTVMEISKLNPDDEEKLTKFFKAAELI